MMRVGIDLVRVSRIAESLEQFGARFLNRVFTAGEIAYASAAPALTTERLAARFAAKEAALKALGLAGRGVGWRDIEVLHGAVGPELRLHGAAAQAGAVELALSLSHEGDYATAIVITQLAFTRTGIAA
ncbi:MAG TPA: holo-ACP synthase [Steroidobacteraceae bacterium]|nr:holo-ACP synthase [Steroidobacteraceae bacterium]